MSGLAAVQARVGEIQARIAQLSPPAAGFALPAPATGQVPATGTAGVPSPGASSSSGASSPSRAGGLPAGQLTADPRRPATSEVARRLADRLPEAGRPWAEAIVDAAGRAGVDPALLASLVQHESGFDPQARSHAGAIGLGQLMPGTARGLGVDPHDPAANLDGAARYLREQLDRFGSAELALAAYNAGPNRVAQAGGIPQITETRNYVQRVTSTWEQLR